MDDVVLPAVCVQFEKVCDLSPINEYGNLNYREFLALYTDDKQMPTPPRTANPDLNPRPYTSMSLRPGSRVGIHSSLLLQLESRIVIHFLVLLELGSKVCIHSPVLLHLGSKMCLHSPVLLHLASRVGIHSLCYCNLDLG